MACALLATTGCTSLAERIAIPRSNAVLSDEQADMFRDVGITRDATAVSPGVTLSWWRVPPASRDVEYTFERTRGGASFSMAVPNIGDDAAPLPARGTVVYLHGWNMDATTMLLWALVLADHGYRGVAVDLRGHGASTDAPLGFGSREAGDIARLLERLDTATLTPPVYLFGVSYGAATALLAEPSVRDRVAGIIAIAPYANAADGIRGAVAGMLDDRGTGIGSRLRHALMRLRHGGEDIDRAIAEAAALLDLDLSGIDVVDVVARTRTCTLLLHGAKDDLVPVDASRRLAAASRLVRYREFSDETHVSLPMRIDLLGDPIVTWLDAVAAGDCPALGGTGRARPTHRPAAPAR